MSIPRFYMTRFKMRNSQFKGKNIETSIDKLNRYFDNVFENVNFFDGAQAAVFRPENPNVFPSTSTGMLADVVLTFTDWTDNFRVDLTNPSILGKSERGSLYEIECTVLAMFNLLCGINSCSKTVST